MEVTFFGASRMVTGSKHLIHFGPGKNVLLDCGMFQGKNPLFAQYNRTLPFDVTTVDAVVISHAHIDHTGLLPLLLKQGYTGKIYMTVATADLTEILLRDSAQIQQQDYTYRMKRQQKRPSDEPILDVIFTDEEVTELMKQVVGVNYDTTVEVLPGVEVVFRDAGHILGSAIVEIEDQNPRTKVVFSGDLGRRGLPVLRDPYQPTQADVLICESTYGARLHDGTSEMENNLVDAVQDAVARGGKIIIPAFSVGRTQEVVYLLHKLLLEKRIPEIPIFVDSPLSVEATKVFMRHAQIYDKETFEEFLMKSIHPFHGHYISYVQSVEESMALNKRQGSMIIIAASGMVENGRVVHHVKHNIADPNNMLLAIGYMAEGTLGRELVDGKPEVVIHGDTIPVRAEIRKLHSFSAHADQQELLAFVRNIQGLKDIFLVHGEEEAQDTLKELILKEQPNVHVYTPEIGSSYESVQITTKE